MPIFVFVFFIFDIPQCRKVTKYVRDMKFLFQSLRTVPLTKSNPVVASVAVDHHTDV